MAKINYNGMELEEFTSEYPVTFEPAKKMLVWRETCEKPHEANVLYVNSKYRIVVVLLESGCVTMYEYCAEIPKKPSPRRATRRELAKWLAQGNGEMKLGRTKEPTTDMWRYSENKENEDIGGGVVVRKWEDTEWHNPDVEYMGIADVTTFEDVVKREG